MVYGNGFTTSFERDEIRGNMATTNHPITNEYIELQKELLAVLAKHNLSGGIEWEQLPVFTITVKHSPKEDLSFVETTVSIEITSNRL
jgi:hypothetical protein